jgi:hypothetical protein
MFTFCSKPSNKALQGSKLELSADRLNFVLWNEDMTKDLASNKKEVAELTKRAEWLVGKLESHGFAHITNKATPSQTSDDKDYIHGGLDAEQLHSMINNVSQLATAAVVTNREEFGKAAVEQLRVFFADPKTSMNPRLTFPNNTATDLVDMYDMPRVMDAIALIQDKMPAPAVRSLKGWFTSFLSKVDEIKSHYHPELTGLAGGAYDVLRMSIATFLGKSDIVREQAATVQLRLEQSIKADGQTQLPVTLQMDTLAVSSELASRAGVDLWGYKTQSGGRLIDGVQALVTDANNKGQAPNVFDRTIKLAQRYAAKTQA